MIWKMNKKSLESSPGSSKSNEMTLPQSNERCFEMCSNSNSENSTPFTIKRKRCDSNSAKMSPSGVSVTSIEMGVRNCGCGREFPADSKCKTLANLDKNELRIIRMQIAMISDKDGDRPIHIAVVQQNFKLLKKLCAIMLKTAISIDLTNYLRQTALHLAVMVGDSEMIRLLLMYGSSILLRDRNGNSVLHLAIKTNAKKEVLSLILSHPQSTKILDYLDYEGYTALHYAVLRKNKTAVTCLHRSGVNMNVTDGKSGRTPLIHAIMDNNTDMVNHLLEAEANINVVDYSGRTAFELAIQASNSEIIKTLERKSNEEEFPKSAPIFEESDEEFYHKIPRTKKFKSM